MSDHSELELLGLLKSKFPHKIVKYDDQIGYKFNRIQIEFTLGKTIFKFMDHEDCVMEVSTNSYITVGDTLTVDTEGAVKFDFSLS